MFEGSPFLPKEAYVNVIESYLFLRRNWCSLTITSTEAPVKSVSTDVLHIVISCSMKQITFVFVVSILLCHALLFHRIGTVYWWVLDPLNTYETHL